MCIRDRFSLAAAVAGTYRRGRGVSVKLRSLTVRLFNHIRFGPFRIDLCCSRLCYERGIWQGWAFTMASEGEDGMNDHLFGFTSSPPASDGSWKDASTSTSYRRRVPHSDWDSSKSTVTKLRSLPISLLHLERAWPVFPSIWNPVLFKLWKLSFQYSESTTAAERTGAGTERLAGMWYIFSTTIARVELHDLFGVSGLGSRAETLT